MPKPIKKRIAKPDQAGQDEVLDFLGRLRDTAATRQRQVVTAVAALAGIIIIAVVIYYYQTGAADQARRFETQGYQAYNGLYEFSGLSDQERAQKALEFFTKSYEARKSPFALLYIADSQFDLGDYQAAIESADKLIREFPDEEAFVPVAMMKKASALLASGQKDKALEVFDKLGERTGTPLADAAIFEAATLLEDQGRKEEADAKYESLVQKYPNSPYSSQALSKLGVAPKGEQAEEKAGQQEGTDLGGALKPTDLGVK
jgi:TolA-binding protein